MSSTRELSAQDAAAKLENEDVQLIDVRTQSEWDGARLHGAVHMPLELLTSRTSEIDKDRPIIFYCFSGSRSQMATQAFVAGGYDAYNLADGIKDWVAEGQPVEPVDAEIVH